MLHHIPTLTGYLASAILAISLMVQNDLTFRWINALGCLFFIFYGLLILALPIVLANSFLLAINVYYLVRIYRATEAFDLIEFKGNEKLISKFLGFYEKDIYQYFPGYRQDQKEGSIRFVVLRDLVIANIFVAQLQADGTARVELNYTVPKYRDYKVGRFIFNRENQFLRSKGVQRLEYGQVANKGHEKFLKKMGFRKTGHTQEGTGYEKYL